ncbi:acyltransferase family protein [Enterobacteriaceae bacterium RIT711]|nr:acyltransferase family protein [Enterobacteriaceae bacterium RIT711]
MDMNLRYRSDIDGLRALAVLLVFAYHLKLSIISGGFVGVDVFFVISGFLITGIVIRSLDNGVFSFAEFFNRRIKRIVPNVLLVATCTIIAGYFMLLPNDYASLISSYFYTSIYAANFYFWDVTGAYFSASSDEMPLLHMWSLAVEEQFYFIWPIILFVSFRLFKGRHLGVVAIVLAIISFTISQHIAKNDAGFAYYMIHTRSGGLLLGAALSLMHRDYKQAREFNSSIAVVVGTAMIIWSALTIDATSLFPGVNSAIPSIGAFLVIAGGSGFKNNFASKIYSLKPVVWMGLISFSVYLWHWPFIAFSTYLGILDDTPVKAFIFMVTILLSIGSLKLVENPVRKSELSFIKSFAIINISFVALAALLMLGANFTKGFEYRFNDKALSLGKVDVKYPGLDEGWCQVTAEGVKGIRYQESMAHCYIGDKASKNEAIYFGDSNAGHFGPFIDELARKAGVKVRQLSTSSCYPDRAERGDGENPEVCMKFRGIVDREISANKYDTIIIGNRWARNYGPLAYKTADFAKWLEFYSTHAKKVILLAQMPEWGVDPAACFRRGTCNMSTSFTPDKSGPEATKRIKEAASHYKNVEVVDPSYLIQKDGKYTPFAMGYLMYHDSGHVSIKGMKWVAYNYLTDHSNPLTK